MWEAYLGSRIGRRPDVLRFGLSLTYLREAALEQRDFCVPTALLRDAGSLKEAALSFAHEPDS